MEFNGYELKISTRWENYQPDHESTPDDKQMARDCIEKYITIFKSLPPVGILLDDLVITSVGIHYYDDNVNVIFHIDW